MPQTSSITSQLPDAIRQQLESHITANHFSGYGDLANWLNEQGYEISRSSIARYGKRMKKKSQVLLDAHQLAQQLNADINDDAGDLNQASLRMIQAEIFTVLSYLETDHEQSDEETRQNHVNNLSKLARVITELSRASVSQSQYKMQYEKELVRKAIENLAQGNLTPEKIRERISEACDMFGFTIIPELKELPTPKNSHENAPNDKTQTTNA